MRVPVDPSNPGYQALLAIEKYLHQSTIPQLLLHLLKLRASQINGCAYCIDMHWKDLRALGEREARLYSLDAWRETPLYSEKERAALEWTEAVTNIAQSHAPDDAYERLRKHFTDQEFIDLTFLLA